jgi:serine/threonine protein kinase
MTKPLPRRKPPQAAKKTEPDLSGFSSVSDYIVSLSHYQEIGSLGAGSFGKVWQGRNRITGWTVAVKELLVDTLEDQDLQFYEREAQIPVRCKGPFLLDFLGFTLTPPYSIITSFVPCGSLWDAMHTKALRSNSTQKTNIAMGMAHGMMYLHRHNVIHRDLKNPNILLDGRLLPKIADFGLSRFLFECENTQKLTGNIGTPHGMATELLMDVPYGPPLDVYAYGMKCILKKFRSGVGIV